MTDTILTPCTAFAGVRRVASGDLPEVALAVKGLIDAGERATVFIFDDRTGGVIEVDFRGTAEDVRRRLAADEPAGSATDGTADDGQESRGRGRPKLGVVSREVTLLPRHWDWLNSQPGGASVALRKLIDEARRTHRRQDEVRCSQEAAYRFMSALAGNMPGYEEATRALFAGDAGRFDTQTDDWPADIRAYARRLAATALGAE